MGIIILAFFIIAAVPALSQIKFEPGYLINNSGQRTECLIRNADWANNPSSIQYRLTAGADIMTASLENTIEFGIGNDYRYIRRTVQVDQSGGRTSNLSTVVDPQYKEMEVFLRVWVSGPVSLYEYSTGEYTRFFYQRGDGDITPLVFKQYLDGTRVAQNPRFRLQLLDSLKCGSTTMDDILKVQYRAKDLTRYFNRYNACASGISPTKYSGNSSKIDFNLSVRPRVSSVSLDMNYPDFTNTQYKFDNFMMFEFGLEAEFILPLGKNRWALTFEPGFFSMKKRKDEYRLNQDVWIDYTSIELPFGVRHYIYLTDQNKLFLNAVVNVNTPLNSTMFFTSTQEAKIVTRPNAGFGVGAQFLNRFSAELRYNSARKLTSSPRQWDSKMSRVSLIAGFRLF
ncbi:MAG: hypothetical protein ACK4E0_16710 [Chitinophagaceae bacterium]